MKTSLKLKTVKILIFACAVIHVQGEKSSEKQGVEERSAVNEKEVFNHSLILDIDDSVAKDSENPKFQNVLKNIRPGIKQGVDTEKTLTKVVVEKCLAEWNFRNILEFNFSVLAGSSLLGCVDFTVDFTGLNKAAPIPPYVRNLIRASIMNSANTAFTDWGDGFVDFLGKGLQNMLSGYYHTVLWNVDFQSKDIISLREYNHYYLGGAHGGSHTKCYTFWMIDGQPKPIKLADLFRKGSDWSSVLSPFVGKDLLEQKKTRRGASLVYRKNQLAKENKDAVEMAAIAAAKEVIKQITNIIKQKTNQRRSGSAGVFSMMDMCQDAIEYYRMADAEYEKFTKGRGKTTENYRKIKEDCNKAIEAFKNAKLEEKLEFEWHDFAEKVSISSKGITFYFAPYDVGCHAEGEYTVHVPFSVLKTVLRSDGVMRALLDS